MATWHPAANLTPATSMTPAAAVLFVSSHHNADKSCKNALVLNDPPPPATAFTRSAHGKSRHKPFTTTEAALLVP